MKRTLEEEALEMKYQAFERSCNYNLLVFVFSTMAEYLKTRQENEKVVAKGIVGDIINAYQKGMLLTLIHSRSRTPSHAPTQGSGNSRLRS